MALAVTRFTTNRLEQFQMKDSSIKPANDFRAFANGNKPHARNTEEIVDEYEVSNYDELLAQPLRKVFFSAHIKNCDGQTAIKKLVVQ